MLECQDCDRSFVSEHALQQHLEFSSAHTMTFDCEDCDRSFSSEHALQQHLQFSSAHAPSFDCAECDRSFASEHALEQHQKFASAHAPSFDCAECDRSFNSEQALQHHLRDAPAHNSATPLDLFFADFTDFNYNPCALPSNEMARLQRMYGWKRNSDEAQSAWEEYRRALVLEFESWYGTDNDSLEAWSSLCRALRIEPVPGSCAGCRKAVRARHVNMVDLLHHRRHGEKQIQIFQTLEELRNYTIENHRYFPKDSLESGALLKHLLRQIFTH